MIFKRKAVIAAVLSLMLSSPSFAADKKQNKTAEDDQQISDFSLSSFGDKGKKSWEVTGRSADITPDVIRLNDVVSHFYGDTDKIKITADSGDFNKTGKKLHLDQNVTVTIDSEKERAGKMDSALKDVKDSLMPKKEPRKIVITCDGPLEMDYHKKVAVFKENVKVDTQDALIYSDIMEVYFNASGKDKLDSAGLDSSFMGSQIEKIRSWGNVKIVRGENISYSDEAIYMAADNKIILLGRPKLVISSTEGLKDASIGN